MAKVTYDVRLVGKDLKSTSTTITTTTTGGTATTTTETAPAPAPSPAPAPAPSTTTSTDGVTSVFLAGSNATSEVTIHSDENVYVKAAGNKGSLRVNAKTTTAPAPAPEPTIASPEAPSTATTSSTVVIMANGNQGNIQVTNESLATATTSGSDFDDPFNVLSLGEDNIQSGSATSSAETYIVANGNSGTITANTISTATVMGTATATGGEATAVITASADASGTTTIVASGNKGTVNTSTDVDAIIDVAAYADSTGPGGATADATVNATINASATTNHQSNGNQGLLGIVTDADATVNAIVAADSNADNDSGDRDDASATLNINGGGATSTTNLSLNGNSATGDGVCEPSGVTVLTDATVALNLEVDARVRNLDNIRDTDNNATVTVNIGEDGVCGEEGSPLVASANLNMVANGNRGDVQTNTQATLQVTLNDEESNADERNDYMARVAEDGDATVNIQLFGEAVSQTDLIASGNQGGLNVQTGSEVDLDINDPKALVRDNGDATVNVELSTRSEATLNAIAAGNGGELNTQTDALTSIDSEPRATVGTDLNTRGDDGNATIQYVVNSATTAETTVFTPGNSGSMNIHTDAATQIDIDAASYVSDDGDATIYVTIHADVDADTTAWAPGNSGDYNVDTTAALTVCVDAEAEVANNGSASSSGNEETINFSGSGRVSVDNVIYTPAGQEDGFDVSATLLSSVCNVTGEDNFIVSMGNDGEDGFYTPDSGNFQPGAGQDSSTVTRSEIFDGQPTVLVGVPDFEPADSNFPA